MLTEKYWLTLLWLMLADPPYAWIAAIKPMYWMFRIPRDSITVSACTDRL